ncbi:RELT-like protein 1 [Protopterus annectens]|uniref:RELT-like protein 1 n=1 Tax=Protopterus annectens TaxID=7888 RepID=UPI001CF9A92F|nr:RELT-like protein 1 [Protopterus annectens]
MSIVTNPTSATPGTGNGVSGNGVYVAFILLAVFFITGLSGILLCHLLKKKGYRCTTDAETEICEEKPTEAEKAETYDSFSECNADTVGQIVHYIMKNEANADMLKAMVADNSTVGDGILEAESPLSPNTPNSPTTPGSPVSPGIPGLTPTKHTCRGHHLHTVGGVIEKDVCTRCSHKRWPLMRQNSKTKEVRKSRPGETTVLSVGRFRVTKTDVKSHPRERKALTSESADGEIPTSPVKTGGKQKSDVQTPTRKSPEK